MSEKVAPMADINIDVETLDALNVEQAAETNKEHLDKIGGINGLVKKIGTNIETGLTSSQVLALREKFGSNEFPESPLIPYYELLYNALTDATLLVLIAAAAVSLGIGIWQHGAEDGWIEGGAIFIAVFAVSNISAGNDYSKQLQFRALEKTSSADERASVLRDGAIQRINPAELVVGDIIVLQAGDMIPADSCICTPNTILANESSLTGEPLDLKKSLEKDPFLISSCLVTEGEEARAVVIGVGDKSQWGKIKANLVTESVNTPLQDKLEDMTALVGYVGMGASVAIFVAKVIQIWALNPSPSSAEILSGFIDAFILSVTIVVVAIPEGLPLAVTISLAYSTKKMYQDMCFIRVLAACETMGNATNICSDKTGTLTENRMTVVEGYFGDKKYNQEDFKGLGNALNAVVKNNLVEHICINRTAYLVFKDAEGRDLPSPQCIGNKTEGALIDMCRAWGYEYEAVMKEKFNPEKDKVYAFNSGKKRSTAVLFRKDGSVRVYAKGASEWILRDCTKVTNTSGGEDPMTQEKVKQIEGLIESMANEALRTLLLAHRDFPSASALPANWEENPPDNAELVCDCVVGIIDPLRSDVKEAVKTAQEAGVIVRMVTGDNIATASAIARQCGILGPDGVAVEGPNFRKMSPKAVDAILPRLRVMARSSPDDKYLLVTRLNGHGIPATKEEWEEKHKAKVGVSWETHKDLLLPGYREEWEETRPDGGDIVGVTGDGTNDAPALKAADVGLAMGITGTKVAQGASDIVILDDKFSSIIKAILWGRSVYDNIRKFLQFQLTVNVVALSIVFIGACAGFGGSPLTAVQMLWVNLVMDTMGALALGTEGPTRALLNRKPYKRSAPILCRPMIRNIGFQSLFQLTLLVVLLFAGSDLFNVPFGTVCEKYSVHGDGKYSWKEDGYTLKCSSFSTYCAGSLEDSCFKKKQDFGTSFSELSEFEHHCLDCKKGDYRHGTIMFNAFIWCQFFNEFTARNLFDEVNAFRDLFGNWTFLFVAIFTGGFQILFVEVFGKFASTSPLPWNHWLICIALGFIGVPIGMMYKFIPVKEDPNTFFDAFHGFVKDEERLKPVEAIPIYDKSSVN